MSALGNKIKQERLKKGLSQEALGKKIGLTRQGIAYIERHGSLLKITAIADALNIPPSELAEYIFVETA